MMRPESIVFEITRAELQLDAIKAFYAACGYPGPTEPNDEVVLAKDDGVIVGVVRLVDEAGVRLLRGMYVGPGLQRRGIGSRMLERFEQLLDARRVDEAFLTCGPHLAEFYGRIGFRLAGPSITPPDFLVKRRDGYTSRYGAQVIMYRLCPA